MTDTIKNQFGPALLPTLGAVQTLWTNDGSTTSVVRDLALTVPQGELGATARFGISGVTPGLIGETVTCPPGTTMHRLPSGLVVPASGSLQVLTSPRMEVPTGAVAVAANSTTTDAASLASSAFAHVANRLYLATIMTTKAASPDAVTAVSHAGTTPPTYYPVWDYTNSLGTQRIQTWAAWATTTSSSAALTFTLDGTFTGAGCEIVALRYVQADIPLQPIQIVTKLNGTTETAHTATFAALQTAKKTVFYCMAAYIRAAGTSSYTADTGAPDNFVELSDYSYATPNAGYGSMFSKNNTDLTPTETIATAPDSWMFIGVELLRQGEPTLLVSGVDVT